jgi:hypothetical protein
VPLQGVAVVTVSDAGVGQDSTEDLKVHERGRTVVICHKVSQAHVTTSKQSH